MPDVTVFYGLYGSGKSEIAINYAVRLAMEGRPVSIVDLDAVTPYFRVRDVREELNDRGVLVVAPKESMRHADLPVLPEGVRRVLQQGEGEVVVDVGGDPTGARVLGGLKDALAPGARGLFVVNSSRPFTRTVEGAAEALATVSASAGLPATGIVANTHMSDLTTEEHVVAGVAFARGLGEKVGLPVLFCAAPASLKPFSGDIADKVGGLPVLWLERFLKKPWEVKEYEVPAPVAGRGPMANLARRDGRDQ